MRGLARWCAVAVGGALGCAAALAGCSGGGVAPAASVSPSPATAAGAAALAHELFDLTNEEREAAGIAALTWSDCLAVKAAERAEPFVDDPDLVHDVLVNTCTPGVSAGENLSRSSRTARQVVEAWMGSAGHRANLMSPDFATSGIACAPAPEGVYACSQLFEGAAE